MSGLASSTALRVHTCGMPSQVRVILSHTLYTDMFRSGGC